MTRTVTVVAMVASMAMLASGCAINDPDSSPTASATPPSDFARITQTLDEAGWPEEHDFDWLAVARTPTEIPEVAEALPVMTKWMRAAVFSGEVHSARSTREAVEAVDDLVGSDETASWVRDFDDDPKPGLEDAAAYGLVISPSVQLADEPRIALWTEVEETDDSDYAAEVHMGVRAAVPVTNGTISRWGVFVFGIIFRLQEGYSAGDDWQAGTSFYSTTLGLGTCEWGTTFSADIADDGSYDPDEVLYAIDYAPPSTKFDRDEFSDSFIEEFRSEGYEDPCPT